MNEEERRRVRKEFPPSGAHIICKEEISDWQDYPEQESVSVGIACVFAAQFVL